MLSFLIMILLGGVISTIWARMKKKRYLSLNAESRFWYRYFLLQP